MVAEKRPTPMTVDEWRTLLDSGDIKYEYSDGRVHAMSGGTADHATIAINLIRDLVAALDDGPCRVYNSDMAVRLSPTEYRFPDASVSCDTRDRGSVTEVAFPRLLVEVLLDSTEVVDRTVKARLFRACPTVEEHLFITTRFQAVEAYRRAGELWTAEVYLPGDTITLHSVEATLTVDALYQRTETPEGRRRDRL